MNRPPLRSRMRLMLGAALSVVTLGLVACAATPTDAGLAEDQTFVIGSQLASFPSLDTGGLTRGGYEGQRLIGNLIYEGLTKRDVSDPDAPAGVTGALAESWEVTEDGLSYTFNLRPDVLFHDGTEWDADAALYNLDRYMNPEHPEYVAELLTYYQVLSYIDDVEKLDELTIVFRLNQLYAYFVGDLYNVYFASPTSLEATGSEGQAEHPVGTGPFAFESVDGNTAISFTANEDWWGAGPLLDRIVVELIPDAATRIAALRSGRVDWIENVPPDQIESLESAGFTIEMQPFDWEWPWMLMADRPPFDDVLVRQAMNYAIDREAIAEDLLVGTAVPAYQMLAEANPYFDPENTTYGYDVEKAKDLLAEAGHPDGIDIDVAYITVGSGSMQAGPMNEALQAQLAEAGIRVNLVPMEHVALWGQVLSGDIPWNAWNGARSLESPTVWDSVIRCDAVYTGYCNPEVDALLDDAKVTVDDEARTELLREAMSIVTDDAAWMFVVNDSAPRAMAADVQGYEQPMSWWIEFNSVYIGE